MKVHSLFGSNKSYSKILSLLVINVLLLSMFVGSVQIPTVKATTLFSDGFASGTILTSATPAGAWNGVNGAPTVVTSPVHSGTYALQATTAGAWQATSANEFLPIEYSTLYYRVYFNLPVLPTDGKDILVTSFGDNEENGLVTWGIYNDSGTYKVEIYNTGSDSSWYSSAITISANTYYYLEGEIVWGATTGSASAWFDGVSKGTYSNLVMSGTGVQKFWAGLRYGSVAATVYIDDVVVSTSQVGAIPSNYYITSSEDSNSVISPLGLTAVAVEGSQAYSISALSDYSVSDVIIDGVNQGPLTSYTFSSVESNHTISIFSAYTATSKLNNAIIIYGVSTLNASQIADIAANYTMLVCDYVMSPTVLASIRSANPNIIIYAYANFNAQDSMGDWSTVDANEAWFAHDVNGSRIWCYSDDHEYLMNTTVTSGWINHLSSWMNTELTGSQFNGTYIDNVWDTAAGRVPTFREVNSGAYLILSDIDGTLISNWHSDCITALTYIESNIATGKKVMINTDEMYLSFTNTYLNVVDGEMAEGWVYAHWNGVDFFDTYLSWDSLYPIDSISFMANISATGKTFLIASGVSTSSGMNAQIADFCYSSALLGMSSPNNYFSFTVTPGYTYANSAPYFPMALSHASIGYPDQSYYQSQSVYMRNFTMGLVLLNPSDTPHTINLVGTHYFQNGSVVGTTINLAAWTGISLLTDTNSPTYSSLSYSTTVAGASCHFNATFNDNLALNPNGQYQFGTNNSGSWVWDSVVNFTFTPQAVSVTKALNTTAGNHVSYEWNITDNAGNFNSTGIQTITVTAGSLDHITVSPSSATITAGATQAYSTTAYDVYNNSLGAVTSFTSWSINASAGGSWNGATYTSQNTGTWIIVGTYSGKTATSTLTVNAGTAYSITVSPSSATVTAGTQKTYTATAYDSQGNNLGAVTASWSITSGASGSWSSNIYTSHTAGSWTVNATYSALQGTASLTVNAGNAYTVTVSPSTSTINSGQQQAYSAVAYDNQGNSLGTITNSASWSIGSGAGGNWSGAVYTSQNSGTFTVTATYSAVQGTATLTVNTLLVIYTITATSDAYSTISPQGEYSVFSGNNQAFVFSAYTGYYVSQVLVDGSPESTTSPYTFTAVSANHTIAVYSTLTPVSTPTPPPTTPPINRPTETLRLYLRSDTYTVAGISAYGLDTDYNNSYSQISVSISGVVNVTYGFRIYLVTSATSTTELTSGVPTALIYLTGNFTGQLSSAWTCPTATIILGYQALKVDVYVSTDNETTWTAQAIFITNVLMTTKLVSSAWIFALNVNMTQITDTACSFSFGDTDHRSTISNIVVQQSLESELQSWRISRGDYVGFELGAYTDLIGEAFYVLLLLLFAGVLYFRYGHFGVVAFFFVLFGGVGGLVWILVPPWAAAAVSALVIIGTSFIVWRVIR